MDLESSILVTCNKSSFRRALLKRLLLFKKISKIQFILKLVMNLKKIQNFVFFSFSFFISSNSSLKFS